MYIMYACSFTLKSVPPQKRRQINDITRALVLSLSVCYHARLQNRDEYEEMIAQEFTGTLCLPRGSEQFRNEIRWWVTKYVCIPASPT